MSELPDAPGCRLPFGLGFAALVALIVLALMVGYAALNGLIGDLTPVPNQPSVVNGPGANGNGNPPAGNQGGIPAVSDRHFGGGSSHATVTGDMAYDGTLGITKVKAYAQDGLAWIAFGAVDHPPTILVALNEEENSVAIDIGSETALGVDEQCNFQITVTDSLVSGHVSCPEADVIRGGERVGSASIELDFTASS